MLDFSKANEWKIIETDFDPTALGKVEANFCLGNGYLGLRSATEEKYLGEIRDLLVAGTFNRFSHEEVTELPNAADVTNIEIMLNGARFDLTQGTIQEYSRELNIQTGLLTRKVIWTSPKGEEFVLAFERMVSLKRLHTIAARVSITPEHDVAITFQSGIDGRVTCDGSQHFTEGETRFYDKKYLQFTPKTIQSGIAFIIDATHRFYVDGEEVQPKSDINILRRRMFSKFTLDVKAGQTVVLEKFSNVYTSRDKELEGYTYHQMQAYALKALQEDEKVGFDALLAESASCWKEKVWDRVPITIDGPEFDQLAIRFAQYHMQLMTPAHDNRMNIGAKGLSGEGYKGHTFWDTEIFLLPYFIFNMPEVARSLEEYRYLKLQGHWIIEMSEMLATSSAKSIEEIRSFISRQKETYRTPYEAQPKDRLRQCVFGGSSNTLDFLPLDRAGNRRFLPIMIYPENAEVHILEDEDASRAYLLQVWAEAMTIYRSGKYSMKFSKSIQLQLVEVQKDFMPEDTEAGQIQGFLEHYTGSMVCSKQLFREALGRTYEEPKRWQLHNINEIMNTVVTGWKPFSNPRMFAGYGRQRGWERDVSGNELPDNEDGFVELTEEECRQLELPKEWIA